MKPTRIEMDEPEEHGMGHIPWHRQWEFEIAVVLSGRDCLRLGRVGI